MVYFFLRFVGDDGKVDLVFGSVLCLTNLTVLILGLSGGTVITLGVPLSVLLSLLLIQVYFYRA